MSMTPEAIDLLLATGRKQQVPIYPAGGDPFFIDHVGNVKDLSEFAPPTRIKRSVTLTDVESFSVYVNTYKTAGTIIFASIMDGAASFNCVLDYHTKDKPEFCSHSAMFKTVPTPEWLTWSAANRKRMSQVDFANWIEDNLHLFVSPKDSGAPSGADLLELVKSLHGHQSASFTGSLRLNTGAYSVAYTEEVDVRGTIREAAMDLPAIIVGGFPLFHGMPAYQVEARLKTAIKDRKLEIYFETKAVSKMVRECLTAAVERVEEFTKLRVLLGSA
jgi:uncharacterized protein YfdQ (DUF2303 family)